MKYLFFTFLSICILSNVKSQDPFKMLELKSNEWIKAAEKLEPFCALPKSNWTNINEGEHPWELNEQFSYVLSGSLDDPKCLENLKVLNQLQYIYPHIDVLFIHQSNASYPATIQELKNELIRFDIGVKAQFNRSEKIDCLPNDGMTRTVMISPQSKVYGKLDQWLNIDDLVDLTTEYSNRILDAYNLRPAPFFGRKPSQEFKTPVLQTPMNIEADQENNRLFVSDYMQQRILILSEQGELLDYIGSGRASYSNGDFSKVSFNGPRGLAYHETRNMLYIADSKNGRIRAVDMNELTVSTILGNGKLNEDLGKGVNGVLSPLPYPLALALDYDLLYISTMNGVWKMDLNGQVAELIPHTMELGPLFCIEVKSNGEIVASDANGNAIYSIDENGLTKLTSNDSLPGFQNGKKDEIAFNHPMGFALQDDIMYLADQYNNSLRTLNISKSRASTFAGDSLAGYKNGKMDNALFNLPSDITRLGDKYYCTDLGNHIIRVVDENDGNVSTLPLLDYQSVCYGYKPTSMTLNDGPEITLTKGDSIINISFKLSGNYVFDPNGFSYVDITTRKRGGAVIKDDDVSDGEISLAIRDDLEQPMEITVDLNMYFYDSRFPGIPYFKSISYTFPVKSGTEMTDLNPIVISIE